MSLKNQYIDTGEVSEAESVDRIPAGEIVLGVFERIDDNGCPVVTYSVGGQVLSNVAQATAPASSQQIGRQVALLFADGKAEKPIVIGFIFNQLDYILENHSELQAAADSYLQNDEPSLDQVVFDSPLPEREKGVDTGQSVLVDGKRVVIEGEDEVVLKCGAASISLNKSGKIAIRGKYLLSRSSGVNRILGGSVQVN